MPMNFKGTALPLDKDGIAQTIDRMDIGEAELWAVITVETRGCGFLPDRRPKILFERHIFSHETLGRFDQSNPEVSNRMPGGYGMDGPHQYSRLEEAMNLEATAALRSASWGIGQVLGAVTQKYQVTLMWKQWCMQWLLLRMTRSQLWQVLLFIMDSIML